MSSQKHRFALKRPKPLYFWRSNPPAQPSIVYLVRGPSGNSSTSILFFYLRYYLFTEKNASITYLGKMLQKLQTKCLNLHAVQYYMHQADSFMHLKMPNSRSEDGNNHLIISESIQTPAWKNKQQQMDSKTQSLRAFLQMLGEQRTSKGEKGK